VTYEKRNDAGNRRQKAKGDDVGFSDLQETQLVDDWPGGKNTAEDCASADDLPTTSRIASSCFLNMSARNPLVILDAARVT
jgi:hypothetical protein